MNERNQAVALMLLSALSFSLMQAVVKLSATHIGTMEQVFCRNLISMAISFVLLRRSHLPLLGGRKYQPALLARSFFGFIGVVMLFYATAGAPAGRHRRAQPHLSHLGEPVCPADPAGTDLQGADPGHFALSCRSRCSHAPLV